MHRGFQGGATLRLLERAYSRSNLKGGPTCKRGAHKKIGGVQFSLGFGLLFGSCFLCLAIYGTEISLKFLLHSKNGPKKSLNNGPKWLKPIFYGLEGLPP